MGLFRIPGKADKTPPPVDVNRVLRAPSADAIKAAEETPVDADDTQAVARRLPADAERPLDPAFKTDAVSAQAEVDELPVAPDEPADPIEVSAGEADPSSPLEDTIAINKPSVDPADNAEENEPDTSDPLAADGATPPAPGDRAAAPIAASSPHPAAVEDDGPEVPKTPFLEVATPFVVWSSLLLVLASVLYGVSRGQVDLTVAAIFATGIFLFGTLLLVAATTKAYSPLLLAGVMLRRRSVRRRNATVLAGGDVLSALGLAESILGADADARLVTTREGVVVYANEAYIAIAQEAGVMSPTGLPPRMDRLFGQAGSESSKMFRLARAAKSGAKADEVITQTMGPALSSDQIPRRRFEVSVRPMRNAGQHIAWRLREVPIESARDSLRTAYADYPRPVFALEKSGSIAWMNQAGADMIGVRLGAITAMENFVLGETKDLVDGLWEEGPEEIEARIRVKEENAGHISVVFTAFGRGGVGEGFVCVEMLPKTGVMAEQGAEDLAADVTDAPFGVAVIAGDPGTDATLVSVNRLFGDAFGADDGVRLSEALPPNAIRDLVAALRSRAQTQPLTRPVEVTIGEGASASIFRVYARPIKRRRGAYGPRQTVLYAVDVSFQKRMEEDYAHDKRLKAIGKISGSVAHDFNNFLQAIMGATEFLMRKHPAGDPSYADLVSIRENGQRARNLTQNLLAFSRKQTLQSEVLSISEMLAEFTPFVQRYVTEKVNVEVTHGRNVPYIKADKSQLELAIMNLAVNARDAMEKGGVLTVSSKQVAPEEVAAFGYPVLDEIEYALIEVADNGSGVPEDIAEKIFEPFFTTKGEGKGTGLGLSTVHGIIGQLGGRIFLHNRPGEGATFRIFLPAVSEELAAEAKQQAAEAKAKPQVDDLTGKGRILIVEDEDSVRGIVVRALAMCGYEITEACDGDEALDIIDETEEPFDLVLSDIMMPEMDGPTLITEAGDKLQGAKVIFMSGYAETAMRDKLETIEGCKYLQKPFTLKKIAATVKEAMAS